MKSQILYLVEKNSGVPNACSFIRVLSPLYQIMTKHRVIVRELTSLKQLQETNTLALITNRTAFLDFPGLKDALKSGFFPNLKIIWDTDDYSSEEFYNEHEFEYLRKLRLAQYLMEDMATYLTCSTEFIKSHSMNPSRFTVVRNSIVTDNWKTSKVKKNNHVAFYGTKAHLPEIERLIFLVSREAKRAQLPKGLRIKLFTNFPIRVSEFFERVEVPNANTSYPRFASWLSANIDCQIGVMLIAHTPLNQGKSALKFLEYSAMGLTTLAYEHPAIGFDETANNNVIFMSQINPLNSILEVLKDQESLRRKAIENYEKVIENRDISNDNRGMVRFIESAILGL